MLKFITAIIFTHFNKLSWNILGKLNDFILSDQFMDLFLVIVFIIFLIFNLILLLFFIISIFKKIFKIIKKIFKIIKNLFNR